VKLVASLAKRLHLGTDRLDDLVELPPLIAISTVVFGFICAMSAPHPSQGIGFMLLSFSLALMFEYFRTRPSNSTTLKSVAGSQLDSVAKSARGFKPIYVVTTLLGCSLALQGFLYQQQSLNPLREVAATALHLVWLAATFSFIAAPRLWLCLVIPSGLVLSLQAAIGSQFAGEILAVVLCASLIMQLAYLLRANQLLNEAINRDTANIGLIRELENARLQADQLREIAEEANRAKMRFLASASHDLRQPLTALSLYSETLNQVARGVATKEVAEHIDASVRNLEKLFNSLLDLSKLDAGVVQVNQRLVSVQDLLNRLVDEYAEQASSRDLKLVALGNDEWIETDPILFERMVRNLLENALRYTKHGEIKLAWRKIGKKISIEVADTGPGIPASERDRIFDEYYQISNPGRNRSKGLGIGLSIVRKLAELLEFEIVLESELGHGSVFRLIGRVAERPLIRRNEETPTQYFVDGALRGKRVLLIDDDEEILLAAALMLRLEGCEIEAATNRVEAMSAFAGTKPDAIVADYRLNDGDTGLSVLQAFKSKFPDIRGLVLTGDTGPEPLREVLSSGYRILHKPIRAMELVAQIRTLLGLVYTEPARAEAIEDLYSHGKTSLSQGLVVEQRRGKYNPSA
jgi:signal transduction histidine kinase/FixJ family two-component response regulator